MGGCPFAKSTLVGNVATENILDTLDQMQIAHGLNRVELKKCEAIKHEIFAVAVKELLLARTLNNEKEFYKLCFQHIERYDRNGTGFMESDEFRLCMRNVFSELGAATPTDEKALASFKKQDVNGVRLRLSSTWPVPDGSSPKSSGSWNRSLLNGGVLRTHTRTHLPPSFFAMRLL